MKQKLAMQGFTLIELMIVVLIISILAGVAYPSYVKQMQKTQRSDALTSLQTITRLQEEYFIRNRSYAADLRGLGYAANSTDSEQTYYDLSVNATPVGCSGNSTSPCADFIALAIPNTDTAQKTSQMKDLDCQLISLDNRGRQSAKHQDGSDTSSKCWH